jgi:hypothetical protein
MRKYVIGSLLLVAALAVVGHLYLAPGGTPSDRGLAAPDPALLAYFQPDYERSRDAFRAQAERLAGAYRDVERGAIAVPGKRDADLTIDWLYVPAQAQPRRLLILTSGIHGVEGPAGSAVQRHFMAEVLPAADLSEMGVLLVHALNPFGFRHLRRVTETSTATATSRPRCSRARTPATTPSAACSTPRASRISAASSTACSPSARCC